MSDEITVSGLVKGIQHDKLCLILSDESINVLLPYQKARYPTLLIRFTIELPARIIDEYINKIVIARVSPQWYSYYKNGDQKCGYTYRLKFIGEQDIKLDNIVRSVG